jgi:hypothetical protein
MVKINKQETHMLIKKRGDFLEIVDYWEPLKDYNKINPDIDREINHALLWINREKRKYF